MSDVDKWRQRALRLENLLDSWGVFSSPVSEMTTNDIMAEFASHYGMKSSQSTGSRLGRRKEKTSNGP